MKSVQMLMMQPSLLPGEVQIGTQIWLDYNLDTDDAGAGIYYPDDDIGNVPDYGLLYTLDAAERVMATDPKPGYRLPTKTENDTLIAYLDPSPGKFMKESGTTYWNTGNTGDNSSGFNGRGAGIRDNTIIIYFQEQMKYWTSTEFNPSTQWAGQLFYNQEGAAATNQPKIDAISIRLIKE